MKIFLVGFPKSGTTSITKALEMSGLKCAHWKIDSDYVGELIYRGYNDCGNPLIYLDKFDAVTQADVCLPHFNINYWPNLDLNIIKSIEYYYPNCIFILNYREPKKIVSSIFRWGNLQKRILNSEIIGLPAGAGNKEELILWIESHFEMIRSYFFNKINFLEVNIDDDATSMMLARKIGIEIRWWGVVNANPLK